MVTNKTTTMQTKHFIIQILLTCLCAVALLPACKKDDLDNPVRLFRPVIKGPLLSDGNWIEANWQAIKDAESYSIQISKDTFETVLKTVLVDTNTYTFEDLEWDKSYQLQVRANAKDTAFNSKWGILGAIKTSKFPTILNTPTINDITDAAVKVSWTTSGDPVSAIKILLWSDSSVVKEADLTNDDISNAYKIVSGLTSGTKYIIYLYSGTKVRGWVDFSTKASFSGTVIDLREFTDRPSVLSDTLPLIDNGSTVILKRGMTYQVAAVALSKTVIIVSGDDLAVAEPATLFMAGSNFDIASGSVIDSIVFNNVKITSDDLALGSKYVFNVSKSCTVGKIVFESCRMQYFRGFFRTKDNAMTISSLVVNNSVISDIGNYGVVIVDNANVKLENIAVTNSTIYRVGDAQGVFRNTQNSFTQSIRLENCTFNEAPNYNRYLVDLNTQSAASGITVKNCIFGIGKASGANTAVRGVRAAAATVVTGSDNYSTSDYVATSNAVPGTTPYTKASTALFANPANGDFTIIDNAFPGKSTTGDPRWRP